MKKKIKTIFILLFLFNFATIKNILLITKNSYFMKKGTLLIATAILVLSAFIFNACTKDDTTKPVITLKGQQSMTVVLNGTFTDPGYTAEDDEDGDISSSVVVSGTVDVNSAGTYTLTYTVSDAAGNIGTIERTVKVENAAAYLQGSYNVVDIAGGFTSNYTDHITASSITNNRVYVQYFANYEYVGNLVYFTVSANTITIPSQEVNCGSGSNFANTIFAGSGTISGNTITITYTESVPGGGGSVAGSQTYTKQ